MGSIMYCRQFYGVSAGFYSVAVMTRCCSYLMHKTQTHCRAMKLRPYKVKRARKLGNAIQSLGVNGLFNAEGDQWKNDREL